MPSTAFTESDYPANWNLAFLSELRFSPFFTMAGHIVKIAAVQAAPVAFNLTDSLAKVERFTLEAARSGAELVIFPYVLACA